MDGSTLEHSDSDSGESWTILESSPSYADDGQDADDAADPSAIRGFTLESAEKDDDTDGISIISDSEPESVAAGECGEPCEQPPPPPPPPPPPAPAPGRPADPLPKPLSADPAPPDSQQPNNDESIRDDDFLGDSTGKLKTYVHRRNKRLSAVLNIIVLGSVITAAGVAIGHMWGARHECGAGADGGAAHATAAAVNKILSNLYRLQEENAALRARLRELSAAAPPPAAPRDNAKHKCRKLFEESLTSKNADKLTKCVDDDTAAGPGLLTHTHTPEHEREFLRDLDKLKRVYRRNRSWLDGEVARRLDQEAHNAKDMKNKLKSLKSVRLNEEFTGRRNENLKRQLASEPPAGAETVLNVTEPAGQPPAPAPAPPPRRVEVVLEPGAGARVSYADSLKSSPTAVKRAARAAEDRSAAPRDRLNKKKPRKEIDTISENSLGEEMSMKDDRYVSPKYKPERKKNDRQKLHKKQKRRNKYEQWEMKGGYLKDYDDFSAPSLEEHALRGTDRNRPARDFERNNYMAQFAEAGEKGSARAAARADGGQPGDNTGASNETAKRDKEQDGWYEKRAALRSEARRRLELELFGENALSAQWYFRRARRRQHCRAGPPPPANHTRRPPGARRPATPAAPAANYKTKH